METVLYVLVAFIIGGGFGIGIGWQLGQKDEAKQQTTWRREWVGSKNQSGAN